MIAEFVHPKLKRILNENEDKPVFYLPKGKRFTTQNLEQIDLSAENPVIEFTVSPSGNGYVMESQIYFRPGKSKIVR